MWLNLKQKLTIMQSEQLNYIPVFMQLVLAVGFVIAMIIISGKLRTKKIYRKIKTKTSNAVLNLLEMQESLFR